MKAGPNGHVVYFNCDPSGRLLSEEDSLAGVREYIWLGGTIVAVLARDVGGEETSSRRYAVATSHLGVPMRAFEYGSGQTVWAMDQEVFGRGYEYNPQAGAQAPEISIPIRFPGQVADAETGLHQNWHRSYSPDMGRYLQPEPMLHAPEFLMWNASLGESGLGVYSYGDHRPMTVSDPTGAWSLSCAARTALIFARYYQEMRRVNCVHATIDKYFHCMANCEATKAGCKEEAELAGEAREDSDAGRPSKNDSEADCNGDRVANKKGQEAGNNTNCNDLCAAYRPPYGACPGW